MKKLFILFLLVIVANISFSQNDTLKYAPIVKHKNMDWYKITFDVELDDDDTLNTELINAIDFNPLENQRQETEDIEVEVEINGVEIEIVLYSYQKCYQNKNNSESDINSSNK